jgi:hypothetical protein
MEKYQEYKGLEEEMMTLEPIVEWAPAESIMINGEVLSDDREIKENKEN